MKINHVIAGIVACALGSFGLNAAAMAPDAPPHTHDGRPSLEGVWASNAMVVLESNARSPNLVVPETDAKALAAAAAEREARNFELGLDPEAPAMLRALDGFPIVRGERRTRLVVQPADGTIPYTPAARRETQIPQRQTFDNPEDRPAPERCLSGAGAPPMTTLNYANPLRIVQTRDHIVIQSEYGDDLRIIPIGAAHGPKALGPSQLGDSVAQWEGATLVIETVGLSPAGRIRNFPTLLVPAEATVVERLSRASPTELDYQFTVIDPKTFTEPWLAEFSWSLTRRPMFEHACHEGNYSLPYILAGARAQEAARR